MCAVESPSMPSHSRTFARALACAGALACAATPARADDPGYVLMPPATDGSYHVSVGPNDDRHWGRPETVHLLVQVAREWHKRHGSKAVLEIGDISRRDGSEFPPHVTHRDGLNIDVTTSPANICHKDHEDQELSLELARLFFHYGATEILYNGKYVQRMQPGVTEWPKHDDHFHVIVDPRKVPAGDGPLLVAEGDSTDGTFLGPSRVRGVPGTDPCRFTVAWRLLGAPDRWQRAYRVIVDRDCDPANGVLADSARTASPAVSHEVAMPLAHGDDFWWQVVVTGPDGDLTLPWQKLRPDFAPPIVIPAAPAEGEAIAENPLLRWQCDADTVQASARVEVTADPARKRIPYAEEIRGDVAEHRLRGALTRGKSYAWRVNVDDGHGNRAASEWRTFQAGPDYAWLGDIAEVQAKELNLREGPSERKDVLRALAAGTRLYVVGRKDGWLRVVLVENGRRITGFVAAEYVKQ